LHPSSPSDLRVRPAAARLAAIGFVLLGAAWVVPLWLVRFPPMLDYPQQLAAAAILRWYGDPAWGFRQAYALSLARPHGGFEMLAASLSWLIPAWLMPLETAGKLVLSLSLLAVVPAVVALCRRTGRPAWYALLALAVTYNHAFYWGFADNLIGYPLVLGGAALADRFFDRPFGLSSWLLLAGWTVLFYPIHLELLLVFVGAVGWLALVRRPGWRRLLLWLSPLAPGLALGAGVLTWAHIHAAEVMSGYQQRLASSPTIVITTAEKLHRVPQLLFGADRAGRYLVLAALLLAVLLALSLGRRSGPRTEAGGALVRTRFASLAAWVAALFFVLPVFSRGYLVSERLLPLAFMLLVPALPSASAPRRRLAAVLTGLLLALHLETTAVAFRRFAAETAGLGELLASAEPGQTLAGLIYEPEVQGWGVPPVLGHFPAYYQVVRGGRVYVSFAQFFNSPVRYRPGDDWEDSLLGAWNEWEPEGFVYERDAGRFRYFLVRGGPERLAQAFGPHLAGLRVRAAGRWFLVERPPAP
jgi:hypothetical protein